ncbi:ABC transporter permease [Acidimangrovimonas sediminis]|uniref:ABC transporter permease n=1 Tax=Acidimangrovimonas sediminis TaxID=2056283 RepID=UPI000C80BB52|nr:ABC transporter permease subunit [Acidimangrovimonas sediminis]
MNWLLGLFEPGHALGLLALDPPGWGGPLLEGLLHTLEVAAGAYIVGTLLGVLGAFGKLYGGPLVKDIAAIYTTAVRAIPELIEILILYYLVPDMVNKVLLSLGRDRIDLPPMLVGTIVLGFVLGAYMTEVLRGAILAVPHGQIEAGRAYGMTPLQIAWRITLPQMLANALPGMANLWLNLTKDTALLAVIGFNELTETSLQAGGTTKAFMLFFTAAGVLYMLISVLSGRLFALAERRARRGQPSLRGGGV